MTEDEVRKLEKQRCEIDNRIKKYYEDREIARIKNNEERYVGKCYKYTENNSTFYFKVLSGLSNNTYCNMHRMVFALPVNPRFRLNYNIHNFNNYDYRFGDIIEFDTEFNIPRPFNYKRHKNDEEKYIEISVQEFEEALNEFGKQLIGLSREDFTMDSKYFKG